MPTTQGKSSFSRFHRTHVAQALAQDHGRVAAPHVPGSIVFACADTGEAFTYRVEAEDVRIDPGDDGQSTRIEFQPGAWDLYQKELRTTVGLLYDEGVDATRGNILEFILWEPAFRALQHGRPVYTPEASRVLGHDGQPMDPVRPFRTDDATDEMASALRRVGFLRIEGFLDDTELDALRTITSELQQDARSGDGRSWWAKTTGGESVCCRVIYAGEKSDSLERLWKDERIRRLASLAPGTLKEADDRMEGVTILYKHPDIAEGLSDIPWHTDCGLGGHSVLCPMVLVGLHLYDGTPEAGEVRAVPGSWGRTCSLPFMHDEASVGLGIRAGDATVHFGDVLHASMAPTESAGPFRTTIYLLYLSPAAFELLAPGQSYNDIVFAGTGGKVEALHQRLGVDLG